MCVSVCACVCIYILSPVCTDYYYTPVLHLFSHLGGTASGPVQQTQVGESLRSTLIFIRDNQHGMVWQNESEKEDRIKRALDAYFTSHAEHGTNVLRIEQEFESLYDTEQLLTPAFYRTARAEIAKIKEHLQHHSANGGSSSASEREILFSKENIYHAMLCCEALEDTSPSDYFRGIGHSLDCFSVSRPDCDDKHGGKRHGKFLVARKRNVYFITFQGIPQLSQWREYESFEEG